MRVRAFVVLAVAAGLCGAAPAPPAPRAGTAARTPTEEAAPPPSAPDYAGLLAAIAKERTALAAAWRAARTAKAKKEVLSRARAIAHRAIVEDLFPPWYGTEWDFYGTSQTPGEGTIACGYFVSTVLRDAGFKVERIRLAQQASEKIVKTLAPEASIRRFRDRTPEEMIEVLRSGDDGLFVVGFDYHVGFVVKDGGEVRFCHSSWIGSGGVACEDPATTAAWYSRYYVVGRLLDDPMLIAWLEGAAIPTRRT